MFNIVFSLWEEGSYSLVLVVVFIGEFRFRYVRFLYFLREVIYVDLGVKCFFINSRN